MVIIIIIIHNSFPANITKVNTDWLKNYRGAVYLAIGLVPIAGISFLWFMGVARDLLGHLEDQFFSTVYIGSGLLLLGLIFVWAALGSTILYGLNVNPKLFIEGGLYMFGRRLMQEIITVFAMSMAGAYVFSTGSIWLRTGIVPLWLAILTWGTAVVLWLSAFLPWWIQLVFPIWVFMISVYILNVSRNRQPGS